MFTQHYKHYLSHLYVIYRATMTEAPFSWIFTRYTLLDQSAISPVSTSHFVVLPIACRQTVRAFKMENSFPLILQRPLMKTDLID